MRMMLDILAGDAVERIGIVQQRGVDVRLKEMAYVQSSQSTQSTAVYIYWPHPQS